MNCFQHAGLIKPFDDVRAAGDAHMQNCTSVIFTPVLKQCCQVAQLCMSPVGIRQLHSGPAALKGLEGLQTAAANIITIH